ncbi:MAG: hypothetical protein PWP31_296 [Clostridia bacterium]|nr:hypothetical protein [Clostridia bacterium]
MSQFFLHKNKLNRQEYGNLWIIYNQYIIHVQNLLRSEFFMETTLCLGCFDFNFGLIKALKNVIGRKPDNIIKLLPLNIGINNTYWDTS